MASMLLKLPCCYTVFVVVASMLVYRPYCSVFITGGDPVLYESGADSVHVVHGGDE